MQRLTANRRLTRYQTNRLSVILIVCALVLVQAGIAMAQGSGGIQGRVYDDINRNGRYEDDENGIAGAVVSARDAATNGQIYMQSSITGADGVYFFANIDGGEYIIEQANAQDYASTTTDTLTVTVSSKVVSGIDFGDALAPTLVETLIDDRAGADDQDLATPGVAATPADVEDAGELAAGAESGAMAAELSRLARTGAGVEQAPATTPAADAGSFTILHNFGAQPDNGRVPYGVLVFNNGVFYGTTTYGGPPYYVPLTQPIINGGNVFRMNLDGTGFRVLHEFAKDTRDGRQPNNGRKPWNGLAIQGNIIYGSTVHGGRNYWGGILYQLGIDGSSFRVLRSFGNPGDGRSGSTSPILVGHKLYGMTRWGSNGTGMIYSYDTTNGVYRQLHRFAANGSDGSSPLGALTDASDGFLYGLTWLGGAHNMGTLFRIKQNGTLFEVLYHFSGETQGKYPYDSLVFDGRRTLYGAALGEYGNDPSDLGVIFKYDLMRRTYTVLHRFAGGATDSGKPNGSVVLSPDGSKLYGTTHGDEVWGGSEFGAIYQMNIDGAGFQQLYEFSGGMAGDTPMRTPLLLNGALYGMTAYGGMADYGVIYRFRLPQ